MKSLVLSACLMLGMAPVASATTLFFSSLTSNASLAAGWYLPSASGGAVIATAPGGGNALTFNNTYSGGDLYSNYSYDSTTSSFTLMFDYLGNCGQTSQCGAFVGVDGGSPNNGGWILSDTPYGGIPNSLPDTGKWVHVSYTFSGTSARPFLEDFGGAAYSGYDVIYFKNFGLTDNPTGIPLGTLTYTTVPEPSTWVMLLLGVGAIGGVMRRDPRRRVLATA